MSEKRNRAEIPTGAIKQLSKPRKQEKITKGKIKMCSTPKMPNVNKDTPEIATPTLADAEVTKASQKTRANTKGLAGRDIKTSARGLSDSADTNKKKLLGE